jgi:pimeloyl-ACP methyl ester carboxylesterase
MKRHQFQHDGLFLSYLDSGGDGRTLVALHAHWMEGLTYAPLAAEFAPEWRVIALDQRGHGHSDHALSYTRDDYIGDTAALFAHLGLEDAVVLGNSLGGVNAYQFAARHPEQVSAMIIEDVGVEESGGGMDFVLAWQGNFATREELAERVGPRYLPYLQQSFRQTPGGWKLAFDPRDMVVSQSHIEGDYWADWLATSCPALLIRGLESKLTMPAHLEQMAARRPSTRLRSLDGGHVVHVDNPAGFTEEVKAFLQDPQKFVGRRDQ